VGGGTVGGGTVGGGTVGGGTGGGVGLVAVHAGSGSRQVPSLEVTSLVTPVVPDGRGSSTFTVKCTVTGVGSVVLFAAGTSEVLGACAAFAGGTPSSPRGPRRIGPPTLPLGACGMQP
jgi:hypothetical protein